MAIGYGVKPSEFWDLSIDEIEIIVKQANKMKEEQLKVDLSVAYHQAVFIRNFIANYMDSKVEIPTLYESYPELFKKELEAERKQKIESELASHKAKMIAFAHEHNRRRKQ